MNIHEIRLSNLKRLIDEYGNQAAAVDALDISQSYISQILTKRKNLGERLARKIENIARKPENWLDYRFDEIEEETEIVTVNSSNFIFIPIILNALDIGSEITPASKIIAFPAILLDNYNHISSDIMAIHSKDDSMSPTIANNDLLLLDINNKDIVNGNIYAYVYDNDTYIRRLHINKNTLIISSDNTTPKYKYDVELPEYKSQDITIIGRVIYRCGPVL